MRDNQNNRVMIIAGEASGDLHGGNLALALKTLRPELELSGIGGSGMRAAGVDTIVDISSLAVVGIWEVLAHFSEIKAAFDKVKGILRNNPPALLILIDYPDFNLRLAKAAKKAGVPVVYYVSPQLWAWRRGRIKTIRNTVRKMLVLFPFEEKIYKEAGVDCAYVGNPLLDTLTEQPSREELARRFGLDPARPVLGLLPGSRRKELAFHLPVMLDAFRLLKGRIPGLQAVIPVADTLGPTDFEPYMAGPEEVDLKLIPGEVGGVLSLMDTAVVASGTATLQTALYRKPMVIIYRLSPLTYAIGRLLVKVSHIGMVNLVAGREIVPELLQDKATPENISSLIFKMFSDKTYYGKVVADLERVRELMGLPGASARAAHEVVRLLG